MKRKDIKAGVVYAETSAFDQPKPIVFLEDGAATVWHDAHLQRGPYTAGNPADKPKRGSGWSGRSQGYATVRGSAELLDGLDCAAELEAFRNRRQPSRDGLYFRLIFSLGQIPGPYAEAVAAYEAEREASRASDGRRRAEAAALSNRLNAAIEGLAEFGIEARNAAAGGSFLVGIDADNAERLLSLLRGEPGKEG